jgi:S-phase kinase-associated protein 1
MAEDKKETIVLVTSDEEQYTVEKKVAERSVLIKSMMEGEWACPLCDSARG